MGYEEALEAAGAHVTEFREFGSYQGDWFARIGDTVVQGSYGSCSGCDAFADEFGYGSDTCKKHQWEVVNRSCNACNVARSTHTAKLVDFGTRYLDGAVVIGSPEWDRLVSSFDHDAEWDTDAIAVTRWLRTQSIA